MIACWLHQSAFRRHLDDARPLPPRAQVHLDECSHCRAQFTAQRRVVGALSESRPAELAPPPFLRSKIMRAVAGAPASRPVFTPRFTLGIGLTAAAMVALSFALRPGDPTPIPDQVAMPFRLEMPAALKASANLASTSLENPFETELKNLQEDTRNAARAFAASFTPAPIPR